MGSGGRNESNSNQLARMGENKNFHELEVHHVWKVRIKRFWAKEAEMSLTAISLLKWTRGKFYMNLTHDMFKSTQSNFFAIKQSARSNRREQKFS